MVNKVYPMQEETELIARPENTPLSENDKQTNKLGMLSAESARRDSVQLFRICFCVKSRLEPKKIVWKMLSR